MMRNLTAIGAKMLMLLSDDQSNAGICEIINGRFEDNDTIDDITAQEQIGWAPSIPSSKFTAGTDCAIVSQEIFLDDVNEITFDLKLDTYSGLGWDSIYATTVVMVDDDIKGVGTINSYDLAVLADSWLLTSYVKPQEVDTANDNG
jgi:hypothetical protein